MTVYDRALRIDAGSSAERVGQAAEWLARGTGPVIFDGSIALRRERGQLACEVIDPAPGARRCAVEYEVLVENAQRALEASPLAAHLPPLPRRWTVVELHRGGVTQAWPTPDA